MTTTARSRGWCEFKSIEVFHDQSLGVGSYGKVCRAKCDELPCAAKLLHDTLFEDNDPGAQTITGRFEQECHFLSTVKHPHIVQYLGMARDPESGRPVLLMELMDESLTKFIERAHTPLPYHTQLNICHDVALALDYLHSNSIVHRDLSSNNVLLIAGSRAKVTDFGMSKLVEANPRMTPLTQCPGMQVYMAPEALNPSPRYTHKLDCFSFGVMIVQVITRIFPDPGEASEFVDNPHFPTGRVIVCFPEVKRRQKHIDLIEPTHPLLPIALHCLKDRENERPSAREICQRLTPLKEEARYKDSLYKQHELLDTAQSKIKLLEEKLEKATEALNEKDQQLREKQAYQEKVERMIEGKARQEVEYQELQRHLEEKDKLIQLLQSIIAGREALSSWPERTAGQHDAKPKVPKSTTTTEVEPLSSDVVQDSGGLAIKWRRCRPAPMNMIITADSATVHGRTTYFAQGSFIYAYRSDKDEWSELPQCTKEDFSLAVIDTDLTAIGGYHRHYNATDSLLSISLQAAGDKLKRKWEEFYPPMPTKRAFTTTVSTSTCLVVAGGQTQMSHGVVQTVEIMNTETRQWFVATDIPFSVTWPRMVLYRDSLFFTGATNTNKVFTCKLESLLDSCTPAPDPPFHQMSAHNTGTGSQDMEIWKRIADIPIREESTLVAVKGCLLALGGHNDTRQPVGTINMYDQDKNVWTLVGEMATPRSLCCVTVQASDELVVFGGHTTSIMNSVTNTTELGKIIA